VNSSAVTPRRVQLPHPNTLQGV